MDLEAIAKAAFEEYRSRFLESYEEGWDRRPEGYRAIWRDLTQQIIDAYEVEREAETEALIREIYASRTSSPAPEDDEP